MFTPGLFYRPPRCGEIPNEEYVEIICTSGDATVEPYTNSDNELVW